MKYILLALVLVGFATPLAAQTVAPFTGATVQVFASGIDPVAGVPTATVPATAFACGIVGPPPALVPPLVNPTTLWFNDQVTAGRYCTAAFTTTLPVGGIYVATVTGTWSGGTTGRSAASNPFSIALMPPVAPTGLAVRP